MIGSPTKRINFTKKTLEDLLPSEKDQTYFDTKVDGLYLIVRAGGSKAFWIRGRIYGEQKKIKIGKFPDLSIENARKRAEEYKGKIAVDQNPVEEKIRLTNDITFGRMFEDFIENYAKSHKKSWRDDVSAVNNHLPHWKNKRASSITRTDVREIHLKFGNAGHKVGANRLLEKIKAIYNKAIANGWIGSNPAIGVDKFKEKSKDRILTLDEIPKFFRALEAEHKRTVKDFILVGLFTAVRKTNILTMQWKDLKLDAEIPTWVIEETKNGESHIVPLPKILAELLKARKKLNPESPYVFAGEGKDGYFKDPKKAWKRILKDAGIEKLVIHDLRRTLTTTASDQKANELTVKNILGHTSGSVTSIYSRTRLKTIYETLTEASQQMIDEAGGINKWWVSKKE